MKDTALSDPAVEQVRAFNRFYTQHLGVLEPYLGSDLSLTQVRLLYELVQSGSLLRAMQEIQASVGAGGPANGHALQTVLLREPKPGDIGWVIQQHGEIYANEYGWNWEFEALVAGICAGLVKNFQPQWERGWMAELNGQRVGSVFVVKKSATTAQLRLLILTPEARGLGLGKRLTEEAVAFARSRGYKKMRLWTNACLLSARFIYESLGFRLTKSEPYQGFGHELVSETWELRL